MSNRISLDGKLNFNEIDLTAPSEVINQLVEDIKGQTHGIICGEVKPYSGEIESYIVESPFSSIARAAGQVSGEKKVDIQNSLGKVGAQTSKYEFYLNTPVYQQYKYRICFFEHDMGNYPVKVVLEQSISSDLYGYNSNSNYIHICKSREEFENLIINIINSKRVINIMQGMINIHKVQMQQGKNIKPEANKDDETSEE